MKTSVCLSVKRVNCDKTKETSTKILSPQEMSIIPLLRECLGETDQPLSKAPIFQLIFASSALSAVTLGEKVRLTQIGTSLQVSNEPKMKSVRCP